MRWMLEVHRKGEWQVYWSAEPFEESFPDAIELLRSSQNDVTNVRLTAVVEEQP